MKEEVRNLDMCTVLGAFIFVLEIFGRLMLENLYPISIYYSNRGFSESSSWREASISFCLNLVARSITNYIELKGIHIPYPRK